MPDTDRVESDDGSWSLTYEGLDMSHDLGGGNYVFRVRDGEDSAEVLARVQASLRHYEQKAKEEGVDYDALSLSEAREYRDRLSETLGNRYRVLLFLSNTDPSGFNVASLRDLFCTAFFELKSSYAHNNSEWPASGDGFYPDELHFTPYEIDERYYKDFRAEQLGAS